MYRGIHAEDGPGGGCRGMQTTGEILSTFTCSRDFAQMGFELLMAGNRWGGLGVGTASVGFCLLFILTIL